MIKHTKSRGQIFDVSLLFFLLFSIFICTESYKLGIGKLSAPKPGLFPLLIGALLGLLTIFRLFLEYHSKHVLKPLKTPIDLKKSVPFGISLFAYVFSISETGFLIPTFIFIIFLLKVLESKSWWRTLVVSLGITFFSYVIFKILLRIQLPEGILGF